MDQTGYWWPERIFRNVTILCAFLCIVVCLQFFQCKGDGSHYSVVQDLNALVCFLAELDHKNNCVLAAKSSRPTSAGLANVCLARAIMSYELLQMCYNVRRHLQMTQSQLSASSLYYVGTHKVLVSIFLSICEKTINISIELTSWVYQWVLIFIVF